MTSFFDILYAQCNGRYQTEIFTSVNVTTINYSDVYNDIRHEMDIYVPDGDTLLSRPVIIYIHGGAFVLGNKGSTDCIDFCESFAKRGYVAVSINYRLSDFFTWFLSKQEQYKSIIRAVYDSKSAVRYLRRSSPAGAQPSREHRVNHGSHAVCATHFMHGYIAQHWGRILV